MWSFDWLFILYCSGSLRPQCSTFLILISASHCVFYCLSLQSWKFLLLKVLLIVLDFCFRVSVFTFFWLFPTVWQFSRSHILRKGLSELLHRCLVCFTLPGVELSCLATLKATLMPSLELTPLGQAPPHGPDSCSQGCKLHFTKVKNLWARNWFWTLCSWREGRPQVSKTPLQYFPWCLKLNSDIKVTNQIFW